VQLKRLESGRRRVVRLATRLAVLAAGAVCALGLLPWAWTRGALPALSPFVAIGAAIGGRVLSWVLVPGLVLAVVVLWRMRWFCRFGCPVGLAIEQVRRLRPKARPRVAKVPPVGQWLALATLAGALVGYPMLLWLDPLAMLNGFVAALRRPVTGAALLAAIGLPLVLLLSVWRPYLWCRRLCPLGATQDLLGLTRRLFRRRERDPLLPAAERRSNPLPRRTALGMAAGAAAAFAVPRWARGAETQLRPPGAVEGFTGLCVRCGSCVRACPEGIIVADLGRGGIAGLFAPRVTYEKGFCQPHCHLCTQVCPSGAIARLTLPEKERALIGLARVDMPACLIAQGTGCGACVHACPWQAITIEVGDPPDYVETLAIDPERCNGCGACQAICPTEPVRAIQVYPIGARRDGDAGPVT
jgi:ferredoxin-type protein NapF